MKRSIPKKIFFFFLLNHGPRSAAFSMAFSNLDYGTPKSLTVLSERREHCPTSGKDSRTLTPASMEDILGLEKSEANATSIVLDCI